MAETSFVLVDSETSVVLVDFETSVVLVDSETSVVLVDSETSVCFSGLSFCLLIDETNTKLLVYSNNYN